MVPGRQDPVGGAALPKNQPWFAQRSKTSPTKTKSHNTAETLHNIPSTHLGMYMSTYSPASFCMVQVGFSSLQKKWDPILSRLVTLSTECHRCKITSKQFQQKFIKKVYLLPLFPPCPWWPPPRRFWPWNYIEILFEKRADINIEWGFTLFLFLLFFKSWAESFRNWSSSSPYGEWYLDEKIAGWIKRTVFPCGLHKWRCLPAVC